MSDWLTTAVGCGVVGLVLWDVMLAVLHIDHDGILAPRLHRLVWKAAVSLSRKLPHRRRGLLALAGPAMMTLSLTVWVLLFIFGFALIVWPHLNESFRSADEIGPLTFMDAIYYSGITGTVLGHGDITPLSGAMQVVAFVEAGLGFALLTGVVAYLLNVVSGVLDRNALAVGMQNQLQQTDDGVGLLIRRLQSEELGDVQTRLGTLAASLDQMQEKMHQFPILDLHYRSLDAIRDPEPMLQIIAEIAIAGQLLGHQSAARRLKPVSEDLSQGITRLMRIIANQFLPTAVCRRLENGTPEHQDRARVEAYRERLRQHLGGDNWDHDSDLPEPIVTLAFRTRIILHELDKLTGWRMDHPPRTLVDASG